MGCDCGNEARYVGDRGELLCADCACWQGASGNGRRYETVQLLDFAVQRMRTAGFTTDQLRSAFEETLATGEPPERQVAVEAREDRWLRGVVALGAVE